MASQYFHKLTSASAGTGKTYSLVENYMQALFGLDESQQKKRPNQILALTFTNKAAYEMRVRIANRLNTFLNEPSKEDPLFLLAREQEKEKEFLNKDEIKLLLRSLSNAPICTFHAFCSQILAQEAALLGFEKMELLTPLEEKQIAENILRGIIINCVKNNDFLVRNLVARFKLASNLRSLGLVEGILHFYFSLVENSVDPVELLSLKTGQKNENNIIKILDEIKKLIIEFENSKLTTKALEKLGEIKESFYVFTKNWQQCEEERLVDLFLALRQSVKGNFGEKNLRQALVKKILQLGVELAEFYSLDDQLKIAEIIGVFHERFTALKLENKKLSFSDLLVSVKNLLQNNLDFRAKIKERFSHIMVDEYQDTSPLQEEILAFLLENKSENKYLDKKVDILHALDFSLGSSLFVVGDKKQSIYGFRGAEIKLFDRIKAKMKNTHASSNFYFENYLQTSYRSSKKVVSLVNHIFSQALRKQKYSDTDMLLAKSELEGEAKLWVASDDKGQRQTQANLQVSACGVAQLLENNPKLRPSDITILVRRIKAAAVIKNNLAKFNIDAHIVGGEGFFQQQEVVDVLSAFKLLIDGENKITWLTVLRSPLVLIKDVNLLALFDDDKNLNLATIKLALLNENLSFGERNRLNNFIKVFEEIGGHIYHNGILWAFDKLLSVSQFYLAIAFLPNKEQKIANIKKLKFMLGQSKANIFRLIEEFFNKISSDFSEPLALCINKNEAVSIMTIHQSKGLEFKIVVLADSESELPNNSKDFSYDKTLGFAIKPKGRPIMACLPSSVEKEIAQSRFQKINEQEAVLEKAELTRILYVALTRAKDEIYLASSKASFAEKKHSKTLLGEVLQNINLVNQNFLATEIIDVDKESVFNDQKNTEKLEAFLYQKNHQLKRLFSSQLEADENLYWPMIKKPAPSKLKAVDGNLAHKLLAKAGQSLINKNNFSCELSPLLDAAFRALAIKCEAQVKTDSILACQKTLQLLRESFNKCQQAIFEMPLKVELSAKALVIEGFCDLVLFFEDFIGVIEFKSGYQASISQKTYLQVFAYAESLKKYQKPMKFAVVLLGSSSKIIWKSYNEECEKLLTASLK